MEEDIIYEFRNIVEESRIEDRQDYYIKLRNVLDLIQELKEKNERLIIAKAEALQEMRKYKAKYENLKIRHNGTKEALRVAEDLEKQYSQEASNLEAELDNSIPISVIQNKIDELKEIADDDNIAEYIKIDVLQELLQESEK